MAAETAAHTKSWKKRIVCGRGLILWRIGWQNLGIVGIEHRYTGIVLAGRSRAKLAISVIHGLAHRVSLHDPAVFSYMRTSHFPRMAESVSV